MSKSIVKNHVGPKFTQGLLLGLNSPYFKALSSQFRNLLSFSYQTSRVFFSKNLFKIFFMVQSENPFEIIGTVFLWSFPDFFRIFVFTSHCRPFWNNIAIILYVEFNLNFSISFSLKLWKNRFFFTCWCYLDNHFFPIRLHLKLILLKLFFVPFQMVGEWEPGLQKCPTISFIFRIDHLYLANVEVFETTCDKKETSCASCLVTNFFLPFKTLSSGFIVHTVFRPQCDFYLLSRKFQTTSASGEGNLIRLLLQGWPAFVKEVNFEWTLFNGLKLFSVKEFSRTLQFGWSTARRNIRFENQSGLYLQQIEFENA